MTSPSNGETRRYWLSFIDDTRPKGQQFLGVCIVEVDETEAALVEQRLVEDFPHAQPGAEWIGAALRKAWAMGCNPGGEVASVDITDRPAPVELPLYQLLDKDELQRRGLA